MKEERCSPDKKSRPSASLVDCVLERVEMIPVAGILRRSEGVLQQTWGNKGVGGAGTRNPGGKRSAAIRIGNHSQPRATTTEAGRGVGKLALAKRKGQGLGRWSRPASLFFFHTRRVCA
jgi:hypothetical protein